MNNTIDNVVGILVDLWETAKVWISKLFSWGDSYQKYLVYGLLIFLVSKILKLNIRVNTGRR